MAAGIEDLGLSILTVPGLFRPHKIVIPSGPWALPHVTTPGHARRSSVDNSNNLVSPAPVGGGFGIDPLPGGKAIHSPSSGQFPKPRLVQTPEDRHSMPEVDSSDRSVSSNTSERAPVIDSRSSLKHINPNIVESIHLVDFHLSLKIFQAHI